MVQQVFTKIGNYIENRLTFVLLNSNCPKLANFEDFKTCLGGRFLWTRCRYGMKKLRHCHHMYTTSAVFSDYAMPHSILLVAPSFVVCSVKCITS